MNEITPKMIEECRNELPPVRVIYNNTQWWGRVTGRKNQFASVYPHTHTRTDGLVETIQGPIATFSWESVCRAVVNGTALQIG